MSPLHDGKHFMLMPQDQLAVRKFIVVCPFIFHPVLFRIPFDLPVAKHWEAGKRHHHQRDAKIFIIFSELRDGSLFVRVAHEIDIPLQNFRVECQCVFDELMIFFIFFLHQHVHKRTVVHAMHSERANKISFHQPKRFGQQQGARHVLVYPVDDIPPEFMRK